MDEVLLIPDEEVGKMPVCENLKTEAIEQKTRFKTGWLIWSEVKLTTKLTCRYGAQRNSGQVERLVICTFKYAST